MTQRMYTDEYFEDHIAIAELEQKFLACIEGDPYYHVVAFALLNRLVVVLKDWLTDGEVMRRWHGNP